MFQETSEILIASFGLIFLAFVTGIILFVLQAKKNRVFFNNEKEEMFNKHQQELLQAQVNSQQQTMQHIGREIHDNVGQKLTLASLYVKQLNENNVAFSDKKIQDVGAIIDESLTELRQLSKSLTQPELANASLVKMLNDEAQRINAAGICYVYVSGNAGNTILPQAEKNILFRMLQEFMQNSLKHSGCRKISISVNNENGLLQINAADDGMGFDTASASSGIGLQNMQRRAAQLNAAYQLNSSPGNGTQLSLQLNLH